MKLEDLKNVKLICFAAGAAAAVAAKKIVTSEKMRNLCVSGIAKGMKVQQEAQEVLKNMKEDAEDLCYEARATLDDEEEQGDEV